MKPYYETPNGKLYCGSCEDIMKELFDCSIDTIITDPPYALEFMGKGWDKVLPSVEIWKEALRIAKPGATFMAFGGTRTYHRLTCAIEDAGWKIKDCIMWVYGSGFPKSSNISKMIDKKMGIERQQILIPTKKGNFPEQVGQIALGANGMTDISKPITKKAHQWNGWGTALKPAYEPIVIAMKPNEGTYANNALKWGVAGLNIDGCRIPAEKTVGARSSNRDGIARRKVYSGQWKEFEGNPSQGRFPANIIHDGSDEVVSLFPDTKSGRHTEKEISRKAQGVFAGGIATDDNWYGDQGSASRFFYCAKASKAERNAGLYGNTQKRDSSRSHGQAGTDNPYNRGAQKVTNFHPTVKPLALIEYLCKLTETPTKGIVLDMFGGSGTTAVACERLNRKYILIEREEKYCAIAKQRIQAEISQSKMF